MVLIATGVIIGVLLIRWGRFEFDWKFTVINFLTLVMTFIATFYLQNVFNRRTGDDRIEKDMIIEQARKVANLVHGLGIACRASAAGELRGKNSKLVLGDFKALNNELRCLEMLVEANKVNVEMVWFREIQWQCQRVKQEATSGRFPSGPLTPQENIQVQTAVMACVKKVYAFIFRVNRL